MVSAVSWEEKFVRNEIFMCKARKGKERERIRSLELAVFGA